jgi:hypothetical protein
MTSSEGPRLSLDQIARTVIQRKQHPKNRITCSPGQPPTQIFFDMPKGAR